ncbi:hypothetical protein RDn1_101 [Candidatus Termititenax dinenymphae]|uniref:Uncharacterized protein n=1 Tax=Candidatus Termititenax dinenymphae TaxID=2218523 RepID=A0A388TK47_9BACT|nr:hypothetical protein RDn1_101 [Candidatus Termititenax dinenymphae]
MQTKVMSQSETIKGTGYKFTVPYDKTTYKALTEHKDAYQANGITFWRGFTTIHVSLNKHKFIQCNPLLKNPDISPEFKKVLLITHNRVCALVKSMEYFNLSTDIHNLNNDIGDTFKFLTSRIKPVTSFNKAQDTLRSASSSLENINGSFTNLIKIYNEYKRFHVAKQFKQQAKILSSVKKIIDSCLLDRNYTYDSNTHKLITEKLLKLNFSDKYDYVFTFINDLLSTKIPTEIKDQYTVKPKKAPAPSPIETEELPAEADSPSAQPTKGA